MDASYVGPHVKLASKLTELANVYGVTLLMSGSFYSILSEFASDSCRILDRVQYNSDDVMTLVTFDCDPKAEFAEHDMRDLSSHMLLSTGEKSKASSRYVYPSYQILVYDN